jgi:site-specific recombinase XerD
MLIPKLLPKFEKWLRDDQDLSELTVTAYLVDIRNFATWFTQTQGREAHVERVAPTDIKDYRAWLQTTQQQKPSSVNRRLAALRAFFKWAVQEDRIGRNPLNGLKPLRQQESPPRWLEPQAEHKLQQALELHAPAVSAKTLLRPFERLLNRDVAMVMLMWKAGLRVSEVAALDRRDVKLQSSKRGTVAVRAGKGHKARTVPLNADVIESLNSWLKIHPAASKPVLFVSRSDIRITSRAIQGIVEQIGHEAATLIKARSSDDRAIAEALNALTPHVLRHTCGKRLLDAGAQLTEVAAILGHEDLNTTRRYTQPGNEDLHRAVGRIASRG